MKDVRYRITNSIAWQIAPRREYIYIYNIPNDEFLILDDEISMIIWEKLLAGKCIVDVVKHIAKKFDKSFEEINSDVCEFIQSLISQEALESYE